jgi:hypothetical protein
MSDLEIGSDVVIDIEAETASDTASRTNSVKEKLATDFQAAKTKGGSRAARIRDIMKNAASQALSEVKDGSMEVGTIAKGSFATVVDQMVDRLNENQETPESPTDAVHNSTEEKEIKLKALMISFLNVMKKLMKRQATDWDGKLNDRYGDRYDTVKRGMNQVGTWYNTAKTKAENFDAEAMRQKQTQMQTDVETKVSAAGSSVAQTEAAVQQRLQEMLHSVKR